MKKMVVLTGAGISAESGLAVFRGSNGLWGNNRIEDVATPEGWYRNKKLVLDFYNGVRHDLNKSLPNNGHLGLVELEKHYEVYIITQNVDNLHERAGSKNVLHLHGELMWMRSEKDETLRIEVSPDKLDVNLGDKAPDGAQLRPDIVWFGEAVPMLEKAIDLVSQADIFVIIGTSLNVYPAAGLLGYAKRDIPVYLIDPNQVQDPYGRVKKFIHKGAGEGVKELISTLLPKQ